MCLLETHAALREPLELDDVGRQDSALVPLDDARVVLDEPQRVGVEDDVELVLAREPDRDARSELHVGVAAEAVGMSDSPSGGALDLMARRLEAHPGPITRVWRRGRTPLNTWVISSSELYVKRRPSVSDTLSWLSQLAARAFSARRTASR